MPFTVDPKIGFWLGVAVTIEIGIAGGAVNLAHVVPADWIPTVTGWSALLAFIGSTIVTAIHGYSSGNTGPLVSAPPPPGGVKTP